MNEINVLSLGAGVQSTTLLLMACHGELLPKPDYVVFADTGWEPKAVYKHVEWLRKEAAKHGIWITVTAAGNIKEETLTGAINQSRTANMPFYVKQKDGTSGIVPRGCTQEYKINAINRKVRELLDYKPKQRMKHKIIKWMGISTDEIERVKRGQHAWEELRYPLIEKMINRLDCMNWLTRKGYPVPPKSSCIGCPFHNDHKWLEMKRDHPDEWREAVEFERTLHKHGLRAMRGRVYLHKSCVPLDEVDLNEDQLEMDLFGNECTGHCGV